MNYSKATADKLNKTQLVDLVINFQDKIEALSNEPLSQAQLVKQELNLSRQVQDTQVQIKNINAETAIAIEKIKAEAELAKITSLKAVTSDFEALKSKAEDSKQALIDSIAEVEADSQIKINESLEKIAKQEDETRVKIETLKANVELTKEQSEETIRSIKKDHERIISDLKFNHETAIKRENFEHTLNVAKANNQTLIDISELNALKSVETLNAEAISEAIKAERGKLTGILEAKHNSDIKDIKHEYELKISILESSLLSAKSLNEANQRQIDSLQAQVAEIPTVIQNALTAAKSNISVINESNKK